MYVVGLLIFHLIIKFNLASAHISYYLYTPEVQHGQQFDEDNIDDIYFDPSRNYKVLFHGWTNSHDVFWYKNLIAAYKSVGINVIATDYERYVASYLYFPAVKQAESIGRKIANVLIQVINQTAVAVDKFHFIGHSLGAHVAGYAGNEFHAITRKKIPRITGLDPAGPLFEAATTLGRLSRDDAKFVDVIHTNDVGIGFNDQIGHADFYPNGGFNQLGCREYDMSCNHRKALYYYEESITKNSFPSAACMSLEDFPHNCKKKKKVYMGEHVNVRKAKGRYFLYTNENPPYGKGEWENISDNLI